MALTKVSGDFIKAGSISQAHLHTNHGITTTHIAEGDKLFFTNARVDARIGDLSTSNLSEGTNLYYTDARARGAISVSGNALSYNSSTGVITSNFEESPTFTGNVTSSGYGLFQGSTGNSPTGSGTWVGLTNGYGNIQFNGSGGGHIDFGSSGVDYAGRIIYFNSNDSLLIYTNAAQAIAIDSSQNTTITGDLTVNGGDIVLGGTGRIQGIDTVSAGTDAANKTYVDNQVAGIVDSAPNTLDTLNELAAALGDDANFSTTVTNSIATKMPLAGGTFTGSIDFSAGQVKLRTDVALDHDGSSLYIKAPSTIYLYPGNANKGNINTSGTLTLSGGVSASSGTGHFSVVNASAYQLNGTYVMDSSRNLVNIAAITASGDFNVGGVRIVGDNDSADQGTAFIRSNGDYLVMSAADGEHVYLNWDSANGGSGHVYVDNALYAKIFYDRHDTNYYVDPASTSHFSQLQLHESQVWNETTQGLGVGSLHLDPDSGTDHAGGAITFGASDAGNGQNAQAGIYVRSDGSYGTKMYFATTDSYATGSKTAMNILHNGQVNITRSNLIVNTDVRAPIFYDSNDTTYFVDPTSTTISLKARGDIEVDGDIRGDYFVGTQYASEGYTIYKGYDNWNHMITVRGNTRPGQAKAQAAIVGAHITSFVEYAENNDTTGWWFTGSAGSTYEEIARITKSYSKFVGQLRSPIFYDSNNTAYYVDPASTSVLNGLTVGGNTVSGFSGTWMGANFAGTRFGGYNRNGGELAFLQDNPSSGKISVLVDGSFYAGENGGFWSIWSGNNYNNRVGIYGDSSGNLQIGTSASENVLRTNHGYIQMGPMNSSHAHIYTDRSNFYFNKQIQLLGGSLINQNDIRAGVFYDVNNTGYYLNPNGDSLVNTIHYGTSTSNGFVAGYGTYSITIGRVAQMSLDWNANYNNPSNHGIMSTDSSGNFADSVSINSYNDITLRLDSNNNNANSQIRITDNVTSGTTSNLLHLDTAGVMTVGRSGLSTGQIRILYNDHSSGAGWDTGVYIGRTDDLPNGTSFPTYTATGGYGIQFQANSDGVFYGMKAYTSGHYRPYINWGDDSGDSPMEIAFNGTTKFTLSYDGINYATASHRAPIFYDSNDTNYYIDPNSSGTAAKLRGYQIFNDYGAGIVGTYSSYRYQLVFAMGDAYKGALNGTNVTGGYGLWWSHPNAGGVAANLNSHGLMNIDNGNWQASFGGSTRALYDMRAPIFYDNNDTTYYIDANSTSITNNHNIKGTINFPSSGGVTHGASHRPAYGIYQEGGSWSSPFPDLVIAMHTGIKMGANASYGGIRFYSDYQMSNGASELMSINNSSSPIGSSHVYVNNVLQAGSSLRAPIFYDSNNTTYYTRPSTSSYINSLHTAGAIQAGSSGTGNIYLGNNGVSGTGNHFRFHTNNSHTYFDGNCGDIHWRQGSSTRFIFYMTTANMTVNGTVTQNSDERIKENIITIDSALNKVNQLRGVYYNRTDINTSQKQIGLIAQEVENVIPEAVLTANDELGTKSISYGQINALLIEAIKEQQTIIDDLKSRIETLENQ